MNDIEKGNFKKELGKKICYFRKVHGISQQELANKLGITNSRVSNWEQGLNCPPAESIKELALALNVSASELLGLNVAPDELNHEEQTIIEKYREKTEFQKAIKILLGIEHN